MALRRSAMAFHQQRLVTAGAKAVAGGVASRLFGSYFEPYRLSGLQRAVLVPYFAVRAIQDPHDGQHIAALGDASALPSLQDLRRELQASAEGRELLRKKPLVTCAALDMVRLRALPEDTFGRAYATYMDSHGFSADERARVRFMEDPELAYIMARYRQVHDFWHVLTGLPPSILGELALKWFEWEVTRLPVCLLSSTAGALRLDATERRQLEEIYQPWAKRSAAAARGLLWFRYEQYLDRPVEEVQRLLNIEPAPALQK